MIRFSCRPGVTAFVTPGQVSTGQRIIANIKVQQPCGLQEVAGKMFLLAKEPQEVKPAVMSRKNFLFAYSVAGARALCIHMSLIRSALLHNIDPYHYYVAVMKSIPYCQNVEDFEKLLPWNIKLPKVGERKEIAAA